VLVGTASVDDLSEGVTTLTSWRDEAVKLEDVEIVQAMFELPYSARESVLPPALHPTNPPTIVIQAWRCGESHWGPFELAQVRIQCRSGLRPRGFVVGAVIDNPDAGAGLAAGWGFAPLAGDVRLRRYYDATTVEVVVGGRTILELEGADPDPLGTGDVSYSSTLNLANTPNGLRLVQLDVTADLDRVERMHSEAVTFDPAGWGTPLLEPRHPVSASVGVGRLVLERVRYCCRPDVLAFEGTEPIDH
jgi:hypothetical protein